jgi:hypothetical protein
MTAVSYPEPPTLVGDQDDLDEAIAYLDDQARFAGDIWLRRFPSGRDW